MHVNCVRNPNILVVRKIEYNVKNVTDIVMNYNQECLDHYNFVCQYVPLQMYRI